MSMPGAAVPGAAEAQALAACHRASLRGGPVRGLADFEALIIGEVSEDKEVERRKHFEIRAPLQSLCSYTVLAKGSALTAWVLETLAAASLGAAIIADEPTNQDPLRAAIQAVSGAIPRRTVYTSTNCRQGVPGGAVCPCADRAQSGQEDGGDR